MGKSINCIGIILVAFLFANCNKSESKIEYNSDILNHVSGDSVSAIQIESTIDFGTPASIDFINDSLMVILDTNIGENVAHIIDTRGKHICSFGKKGRGEGELLSPKNLTITENNDSIYLFDVMMNRMIGYSLTGLLNGESQSPKVVQYDINIIPDQEYRFMHIEAGSSGNILGFSADKNRIVSIKGEEIENIYSDYPPTDSDVETNRSIWNYTGGLYSISPDREKLVVATYIGGLFEIFDITNNHIVSKVIKGFYKPVYKYAEGAIPKCVIPNPENMITGFRTISAGYKDFIAVIDGPESSRINEILTFDYNGDLKNRKILKNAWCNVIGRNQKGDVFFFGWDKNLSNMHLYKVTQ